MNTLVDVTMTACGGQKTALNSIGFTENAYIVVYMDVGVRITTSGGSM